MTAEQRRDPRIRKAFMIRYRTAGSGRAWDAAPLRDLSRSGVRFLAAHTCDRGQVLDLQLLLPTAKAPVSLRGEVMWSKTAPLGVFELGVAFHGVTPDTATLLQAAVEHFIKQRDED